MIKFFRKIRYQLLGEGKTRPKVGQAGKYLKYAIGEIVLVMVGILLALQVNNWNQKVKDGVKQKSYLNSLIIDLSKDTIAINNILTYQIEDSLMIASHQKKLTKKDASLDSLLKIMVYHWNPRIGVLRSFNTNTVEAVVSTGNINLIDSEILNNLAILKSLQETYISMIVPFIEFYRNIGNPSVSVPTKGSVINHGPIFDQMIEDVDRIKLAYKFNELLTVKRLAYRNSISSLNGIKSKTKNIIQQIQNVTENTNYD